MGALMARKDLLKGLMTPGPERDPTAAPSPAPSNPRYTKGAIGAVTRGIADLKARAVVDLDPLLIDAGGMQDRLETDNAEDAALMRSIAEYGQQVPVLVRPHPEIPDRFQIVYGRRRVLAMRDLGQPVKALIRDLDDQALVLAQGQENTARRDLSFIEKCNFARQMVAAGYNRQIICDALSVDKTLISRMISVSDRIPLEVIEAIGAAPSIGRDRWLALANHLEQTDEDPGIAISIARVNAASDTSDARFEALFHYLSRAERPPAPPSVLDPGPAFPPLALHTPDGKSLGMATRQKSGLVLRLNKPSARGFDDWLVENIADLYRQWSEDLRDQDKP